MPRAILTTTTRSHLPSAMPEPKNRAAAKTFEANLFFASSSDRWRDVLRHVTAYNKGER